MSLPTRLGQALLRLVWYGVIPALLAGLLLRHCLPAANASGPAALLALAKRFMRYPVPAFVSAFLVFAALIRYWRFHLPWGYCLAELPPHYAAAAPRGALAELESASQFRNWLTRLQSANKLPSENEELALALSSFDAAFRAQDVTALQAPRRTLTRLASEPYRRKQLTETAAFVAALALAAVAALYLRQSSLQSYSVLSSSMLPTLEKGDVLSANLRAYGAPGGATARGDVVVFHHAAEEDVVKRVIGLPGDEIRMHGGFPIINGWEVPHCDVGRYVYLTTDSYVDGRIFLEYLGDKTYLTLQVPPARPFGSYTVKPGEVFVLGDNRNLSLDSRNWNDGEPGGLALQTLVGRVDRLLIGHRRNGDIEYGSLLRPLGVRFNANGIDATTLNQQLAGCLKTRPAQTQPPAAGSISPLSQAGGTP